MAKNSSVKPTSKARMAQEERRWRAEGMVKDVFMNSPLAKRQIKEAERVLAQVEKQVKSNLKKGKKGGK